MRKRITLLLLFIFFLFMFTNHVYAKENITIDTKNGNDSFEVTYKVGDEEIYGLSSELQFDPNIVEVSECTGKNDFKVSFAAKDGGMVVVAENLVPVKNDTVAVCSFRLKSETASVTVKDISTSNSRVLARQTESANQLLKIENTFLNASVLLTFFAILLIGVGVTIIFRTKNRSASLALLLLLIPFRVFAVEGAPSSVIDPYTEEGLQTVRGVLLKTTPYDESKHIFYDVDKDKTLTIHDLISINLEINRPTISVTSTSKGDAEYATEVSSNIVFDSKTDLTEVKYCFGTSCHSLTEQQISSKKIMVKYPNNKDAQKICVQASNKLGLTRTICDSKNYLVDGVKPTLTLNKETITITSDKTYNTKDNVKSVTYGVGSGSVACTSATAVGTHTIKCTATGKNGLKDEKTFTLKIEQKVYKVLFVGNSKTYVKDIPTKFKNIATANGYVVETTAITEGGKTLQWHSENSVDDLKAIKNFDYVVLQEGYNPLTAETSTDYYNGAKAVVDLLTPNNPGMKVFVRALWTKAIQNESDGNFYMDRSTIAQARKNAEEVSTKLKATTIYDGKAFEKMDADHHSTLLFTDATGHQTEVGAYLSAACIYKKVFNKSPVGTTYYADVDESTAKTLLSIANSLA